MTENIEPAYKPIVVHLFVASCSSSDHEKLELPYVKLRAHLASSGVEEDKDLVLGSPWAGRRSFRAQTPKVRKKAQKSPRTLGPKSLNKKSRGESEKSRPKKGFFETFRTLPETFFQTSYAAAIGAVVCSEIRAFTGRDFFNRFKKSLVTVRCCSNTKMAVNSR